MLERRLDRRIDRVEPHCGPDERVEQTRDTGAAGTDVWCDGFTEPMDRDLAGSVAGSEHGARRVGVAERSEGALCGFGTVDDDGGERLAERGLDRLLPTVVDLDQIEQGAEHTIDAGESLGTGTGVSGVERELQRLDTSAPSRCRLATPRVVRRSRARRQPRR